MLSWVVLLVDLCLWIAKSSFASLNSTNQRSAAHGAVDSTTHDVAQQCAAGSNQGTSQGIQRSEGLCRMSFFCKECSAGSLDINTIVLPPHYFLNPCLFARSKVYREWKSSTFLESRTLTRNGKGSGRKHRWCQVKAVRMRTRQLTCPEMILISTDCRPVSTHFLAIQRT